MNCFSRRSLAGSNEEVVKRALAAVREACGMFRAESKADQMPREVARRYGLKHEDALEWYARAHVRTYRAGRMHAHACMHAGSS